jgi:thiol-disulfide isomerase/thioredoxin
MSSSNTSPKGSPWTLTRIGMIAASLFLAAATLSAIYKTDEPSMNAGLLANSAVRGEPYELPAEVLGTSFRLVDGGSRKISDYAGKVLVVDLWATWCRPCRQEIPHLIEMANEYKSKGVEVIGLSTEDPEADAQLVRDFSQQFKINYPIGWAETPLAEQLMNGRDGIPQTIIIGRDGKVKRHFVGFNKAISVPQMKAALDEAVAETL